MCPRGDELAPALLYFLPISRARHATHGAGSEEARPGPEPGSKAVSRIRPMPVGGRRATYPIRTLPKGLPPKPRGFIRPSATPLVTGRAIASPRRTPRRPPGVGFFMRGREMVARQPDETPLSTLFAGLYTRLRTGAIPVRHEPAQWLTGSQFTPIDIGRSRDSALGARVALSMNR
jgi:hypothetical protein